MSENNEERKTVIAVLASHDSVKKNNDLAQLFEELYDEDVKRKEDDRLLDKFHFVFTGGTFNRLVLGEDTDVRSKNEPPLVPIGYYYDKQENEEGELKEKEGYEKLREFLKENANATRLPDRKDGGMTVLSNLVVQRQCSILWSFFSPITVHWLNPENLALMRLCELWNVKRLMNPASVREWFHHEAERDIKRNRVEIPLKICFGPEELEEKEDNKRKERQRKGYYEIKVPEGKVREHSTDWWSKFKEQTIALIAHDEMKDRIVDFAIQYEDELVKFERILATGATARAVENACRKLKKKKKVKPCLSGPKGGDIEIATAVLFNKCHTVIFFIDPLNPHPHIEDIRAVFSACMAEIENNDVRMLTNEVQAREWIEEAVRRRTKP